MTDDGDTDAICPRCGQHEAYGCSCTSHELAEYWSSAHHALRAKAEKLAEALEEAVEIVHKAYVSATMEAVNGGPAHPLQKQLDAWRVRCLRSEEGSRAALADWNGGKGDATPEPPAAP